jgi:hypothetical protein
MIQEVLSILLIIPYKIKNYNRGTRKKKRSKQIND